MVEREATEPSLRSICRSRSLALVSTVESGRMSDEAPTKLTIKLATTDAAESAVATPEKAKRKRAPKKAAGEPAASRVKRGGVRRCVSQLRRVDIRQLTLLPFESATSSIVAGPSSPHSSTQSSTKPTTSLPPAAQTATVASKSHGSYLPNMLLEHPSAPPVRRWTRSVRGIPSITGIPLKVKCWKGGQSRVDNPFLEVSSESRFCP